MVKRNIVLPVNATDEFDRTGLLFDNQLSTLFDGATDFINLGLNSLFDFDPLTDPLSISVWWKTDNSGQLAMFSKQLNSNNIGYRLVTDSNRVDIHFVNGASNRIEVRSTNIASADAAWHHMVMMFDGGGLAAGVSMVLDGIDITSSLISQADTLTTWAANTANAQISGRNGASNVMDGSLDEVSVFDIELSVIEAQELFNSGIPNDVLIHSQAANLITYHRMGDFETNTFPIYNDQSGNSTDGTATNMLISSITVDVPP